MSRIGWWLVDTSSRLLERNERDAVRGDLAESGETFGRALVDVLGLIVRRQAALWRDWRPWLALFAFVVPFGTILNLCSTLTANRTAVYFWLYVNNWDWTLLSNAAFLRDFPGSAATVLAAYATLMCWSFTGGFALGALVRRAIPSTGTLFCAVLFLAGMLGLPQYFQSSLLVHRARDAGGHSAIFAVAFYRVMYPSIVRLVIAAPPLVWGMRQGARLSRLPSLLRKALWIAAIASVIEIALQNWFGWLPDLIKKFLWEAWEMHVLRYIVFWPVAYLAAAAFVRRRRLWHFAALFLVFAAAGHAADPPKVRAALQSPDERRPAPEFALQDSSGKTVQVKSYRGKVLLLDFWATWCHGCKEEIPWFAEFHRKYQRKGLAVVGVSLDEEGWKVVQPFLEKASVPYRIVLGNETTAKKYSIENMPDTFLIDQQGRIAAAYSGLVDKDDVEANIQRMLSRR